MPFELKTLDSYQLNQCPHFSEGRQPEVYQSLSRRGREGANRYPNSQLIVSSISHLILPKSDPFSQTWARQSSWQYGACVCFYSSQLLLPTDDSVDARKANITHTDLIGPCWDYVVTLFSSHTCYSLAYLFNNRISGPVT